MAACNNSHSEEEKQLKNPEIMESGDCIILMDRSRKYQHITILSKMTQRINRTSNINLSILQHKPYGSVFELIGNKLVEISPLHWKSLREQTNLDHKHKEIRDNQQIFHQTNNQTLTQNEILKMKSAANQNNTNTTNNTQPSSDDSLITKIAESSKTFHLKTEFSKEKYLKSKKAKHSNAKLLTLKANSSNITEMYFTRKPDKTMGIRIDTVSQILSFANIHHNQYILCVESMTGLIIGSIAERMHGTGKIFNIYCGKHPVNEIANNMFYFESDKHMEIVYNVNIGLLNDPLWIHDSDENHNKLKQMMDSNSKVSKYKSSRPTLFEIKQWIKFEKCDALILCCKYHPWTLFTHLYAYLDYGCPFVVWSEYIQPLVEIKEWFTNHKSEIEAVGLRVHENWFREQQILPQRTHPMVSMQHLGGYILSGIKVRVKPSYNVDNMQAMHTNVSTAPTVKKRKICQN